MGHLCARGLAGVAKFYDPHRLKAPLIRTNPEKGRGVDPKWREASWDEALELVAAKLRKIRQDNPNKLICSLWAYEKYVQSFAWGMAFGSENRGFCLSGVSNQCANPNHFIGMLTHGALVEFPDLECCNYHGSPGSRLSAGLLIRTRYAKWFHGVVVGAGILLPLAALGLGGDSLAARLNAADGMLAGFYAFRVLIFKAGVYDPVMPL
ncbi:MAG: hypothetical protein EXR29_17040 [Betaproteobacteria bacterium]|nr:hypothetical protein [Betaproteobacteria bacterium]